MLTSSENLVLQDPHPGREAGACGTAGTTGGSGKCRSTRVTAIRHRYIELSMLMLISNTLELRDEF